MRENINDVPEYKGQEAGVAVSENTMRMSNGPNKSPFELLKHLLGVNDE